MDQELQTALDSLDHGDDAHWTQGGLPNLNVLKEKVGHPVKRDDVPKEFVRDESQGLHDDPEPGMTLKQKVGVMIVALSEHRPLPIDLDLAVRAMNKWSAK